MPTNNGLSTPLKLCRFMHILKSVPDTGSTTKENVGTGDGSTTVFFLDKVGVIEGTYTLYKGPSATATYTLTETTHYALDTDNSQITLTSSGKTLVGNKSIFAQYKYNDLELLNSEIIDELNASENRIMQHTDQVFTDTTSLAYNKIYNEYIYAQYYPYKKVFDLKFAPIVKLQTTTNGDYTTGATTITLTDASIFPATGTIYIDGNIVTYSLKTGNVLTIPASTPSIASGAKVRGEIIELSMEPEGQEPSFKVLNPDTDYDIDYDQGRFRIHASAYWGEVTADSRIYPSNYIIRATYMNAWHDYGENPTIPEDIVWATNALTARKIMGSVVAKAHASGLNDFNPKLVDVDKEAIDAILEEYSTLNVGTSFYNKQNLS